MQGNNNDELLKKALKEKLDWYTMYATEDEYNEEDVEHILSLLDSLEPLEEGEIPPVEEAWGRFCQMREKPRELLPLEKEVPMEKEVPLGTGNSVSIERDTRVSCKTGEPVSVGERKTNAAGSHEKSSISDKGKGKFIEFVLHHKVIVAAIFLVMVLAVGGSIQAGAIKNSGFFMWLKHDDTGTQMITSPETLDSETSITKDFFYSERNDMPEWTQEWLKIEEELEISEKYEWQCFEIKEFDFKKNIIGHYLDKELGLEMLLGVYIYADNIFYDRDGFANYDFIESYQIDYGQCNVYCKKEQTGEIYYIICFYEGNCKYIIRNQDDLEELKRLAEQYWNCVK